MTITAKAIRIEIHYADGSLEFAEGEAASQILAWWNNCEAFCSVHGMRYHGPKLEAVEHDA